MRFDTVMDREFFGWVFAEYEPGKRVTADMVAFDTKRRDVFVNQYGVVYFRRKDLAERLLKNFSLGSCNTSQC